MARLATLVILGLIAYGILETTSTTTRYHDDPLSFETADPAASAPGFMRSDEEQAAVNKHLESKSCKLKLKIEKVRASQKHKQYIEQSATLTVRGSIVMIRVPEERLSAFDIRFYDGTGRRVMVREHPYGYILFDAPIEDLIVKSMPDLVPESTPPSGSVGQIEVWSEH